MSTMQKTRDVLALLEAEGLLLYKEFTPYRVEVPYGQSGPWSVAPFQTEFGLEYLRWARDGRATGLGLFTRLRHKDRGTVMSDTCPEVADFIRFLPMLYGNVLITGLGLGMAIRILTRQKVTPVESITVIEKEADVIKLVAGSYKDKRVKIIHADALEWRPDKGTMFDAAWHDIWDYGGDSADSKAIRLHYRRYVEPGHQYCWGAGH